MNSDFFSLLPTFCSYPKVAISKHFTVDQAETLIKAQSSILPLNRHFWVAAVMCCHFHYSGVPFLDGLENQVFILNRKSHMSPVEGLTYDADEGSSPNFSKISINHSGL